MSAHRFIVDIADLPHGAQFIDARWFLPGGGEKGREAFGAAHLPGAVFFDIDAVATADGAHPHLTPGPAALEEWLTAAGIDRARPVVVYDEGPLFSAPRVWWLLRAAGLGSVLILRRGFHGWRAAGGETETGTLPGEAPFDRREARLAGVVDRADVQGALATGAARLVDVRSSGRFCGTEPEPRPGLPSGHAPGALNLPFARLLDGEGALLPPQALQGVLAELGLQPKDPVIATCGSGVSACILLLALEEAGWVAPTSLYEGSWIDWASASDTEIVADP